VQAARDNIRECPGIFVKIGLETWRGVLKFIETDLPRAFSRLDDLHILGDLADTSTEAAVSIKSYIEYLETDLAPRAKASFRLGRESFERKLKLDEGISLSADRLLAIALRELLEVQEEFRAVAGRMNGGDPITTWRRAKEQHPEPGQLVNVAQEQVQELAEFLQRQGIVSLPDSEPVVVAPSPEFYRWAFASMWTPGPFESKPSRAFYYLTDVDREWSADRQEEHMRDFNVPTLWNISIHEVYPGHFLHFQHLRHVDSKVRKSMLFAPASFVEGWAHYCEQMMTEAGFRRGDDAIKLGQLAEALVRLARAVVAIRLHCEDLSVEQGMRFFRDEAFLEEATARREAERGTFDPTYLVYSVGKLMLLKLRRDYKEAQGGRFSMRAFHDAILAQGNAPFWAHRRLMLGDASEAVLEQRAVPLYEYECDACGRRFELIRKFSDPPVEVCTVCGKGPVRRLFSSPAIQFKGSGWYITDYSQKGKSGKSDSSTGDKPAEAKSDTGKADDAAKSEKTAKPAASSTTGGSKD